MKPVKYSKLKTVLRVRPPKNDTKMLKIRSLETQQLNSIISDQNYIHTNPSIKNNVVPMLYFFSKLILKRYI